mgnify:CR=1 FL=1
MLLEISEDSNLLHILINDETLIFYKNSLNFIFSNQSKIQHISITDLEPNEFNNLIEKSDWFLIVSQGFQGKYDLEHLIRKYNFQYLEFLALISVSLGVLNLLPIPMLDGGHLLNYLLEFITGKPVPETLDAIGLRVGFVILMGLMGTALYNDLAGLI